MPLGLLRESDLAPWGVHADPVFLLLRQRLFFGDSAEDVARALADREPAFLEAAEEIASGQWEAARRAVVELATGPLAQDALYWLLGAWVFRGRDAQIAAAERALALIDQNEKSHTRFQVWNRLRELKGESGREEPKEVLGAIGEIGFQEGTVLAFGFVDGSASMDTSSGRGTMGPEANPAVVNAARQFCQKAREALDFLLPAEDFPFPEPGQVRFAALTTGGVMAAAAEEQVLAETRHRLSPLFFALHDLLTSLRLAREVC